MQTIEITDPKEARRCRYAQFRGEKVTVILNGLRVTGRVRAVKEHKSSNPRAGPSRWYLSSLALRETRAKSPLPGVRVARQSENLKRRYRGAVNDR